MFILWWPWLHLCIWASVTFTCLLLIFFYSLSSIAFSNTQKKNHMIFCCWSVGWLVGWLAFIYVWNRLDKTEYRNETNWTVHNMKSKQFLHTKIWVISSIISSSVCVSFSIYIRLFVVAAAFTTYIWIQKAFVGVLNIILIISIAISSICLFVWCIIIIHVFFSV